MEEAIAIYKKAIELDPIDVVAYKELGEVFQSNGQIKEAIIVINKAIDLDPTYADAYNNLGFALQTNGERKTAIEKYNKAIELKPNFALAYYNLGNALLAEEESEKAITAYEKTIEFDPNHTSAYLYLGLTLQKNGLEERASWALNKYKESLKKDFLAINVKNSSRTSPTGGVDLSAANNVLQTRNSGEKIKFHLNPAQLAQLQDTLGFMVGSITIQPLKSLSTFLEINVTN